VNIPPPRSSEPSRAKAKRSATASAMRNSHTRPKRVSVATTFSVVAPSASFTGSPLIPTASNASQASPVARAITVLQAPMRRKPGGGMRAGATAHA